MSKLTRQQILQQIAAIPAMERGKLSAYTYKDRSPRAIPHQKLQAWEDGKNHTRFVAEDEVPAVQAALDGYAQYQELTREYADLVIAESRKKTSWAQKKPIPPQILLAQEEEIQRVIAHSYSKPQKETRSRSNSRCLVTLRKLQDRQ